MLKIVDSSTVHEADIIRFLSDSSTALAYHRLAWLRAIEATYRHRCRYFVAIEDGEIVGVLPICFFRGLNGRVAAISLPYCDVGGTAVADKKVSRYLIDKAIDEAEKLGCVAVEIRAEKYSLWDESRVSGRKVRMELSLPESEAILLKGLRAKVRSQVRKAEKNSLVFSRESSNSGLRDFYSVYSTNMRALGSPPHSLNWFRNLKQEFGNDFELGKVTLGTKCLAAAVLLFNGKVVSVPWASSLRGFNRLAPNMLLYWGLLQTACERRCIRFDFGRSTIDSGTYRFKQQWGASPVILEWGEYDVNGAFREVYGVSAGTKRRVLEAAWKRLPLSVTNSIGPCIRGHISL